MHTPLTHTKDESTITLLLCRNRSRAESAKPKSTFAATRGTLSAQTAPVTHEGRHRWGECLHVHRPAPTGRLAYNLARPRPGHRHGWDQTR